MEFTGIVKGGSYFDSVALMIVTANLSKLPGVVDAAVVMGTAENKSILKNSNLLLEEFKDCDETDLLIAIKADNKSNLENAILKIDDLLDRTTQKDQSVTEYVPRSLDGALGILPDANLALISVPGRYAFNEALKALQRGLHVMLFSDNVSISEEIKLKEYATEHDLLVMGPDCGTAIINGVPLAFANVVNRGDIGIVAASGTGLQEVSTLLSRFGKGISQAIGTGGRDLTLEVGGTTFIDALQLLAKDPATEKIVLISKPPHPTVLKKIATLSKTIKKPLIGIFLGAKKSEVEACGIIAATTLEEAAIIATGDVKLEDNTLRVAREFEKITKGQRYGRALFSGGTFCSETKLIWNSKIDSAIDLGADEYTVGRPHPMIDFSTRNKKIIDCANDPDVALILLDIVLGYGSNLTPLEEITPAIVTAKEVAKNAGRYLPIICSVTGTDDDPQNRSAVVQGLEQLGVVVCRSNAEASKLTSLALLKLEGRGE